jgi:hypothetical protein
MPGEHLKVVWPRLVVALKRAGSIRRRPGRPDERAAKDFGAVCDLLIWAEGHGNCGGWTYDPEERVLSCKCGPLFEFGDAKTGETA